MRNFVRIAPLFFLLLTVNSLIPASLFADQNPEMEKDISRNGGPILKLSTVMRKAAFDYFTVEAGKLDIEALRQKEIAVLLNIIRFNASVSRSYSNGDTRSEGLSTRSELSSLDKSIGIGLHLSFLTLYQEKGLQLTEEMKKSSLIALQMQLGTESASNYMDFFRASVLKQYFLILQKSLLDVKARCTRPMASTKKKNEKERKEALCVFRNPGTIAILNSEITQITSAIERSNSDIQIASAQLERFLGYEPTVLQAKAVETANHYAFNSTRVVKDFEPIDWEKWDSYFEPPETIEEAIIDTKNNPIRIQAGITERLSENQWFLTLAAGAPHISLSFSKNFSDIRDDVSGMGQVSRGNMFMITVGISLGAGLINDLNAAAIDEQIAKLKSMDALVEVRKNLKIMYRTMENLYTEAHGQEDSLIDLFKNLDSTSVRNDNDFLQDYLNVYTNIRFTADGYLRLITAYQMTRIQIAGMVGNLLEKIKNLRD